jgi:pyochelin biosynthetic protein PchC
MTVDDLWTRRFHPAPQARVRLVCFPYAGGSASFYFPLSRALSPAVDVLALQYPGRQDRRAEPTIDDLGELTDQVLAAIEPWDDLPLAFFGHSMGATLAFEVARKLERKTGTVLVNLFASGRRAPSRLRNEDVHLRDDAALVRDLRRLNGTDARILADEELLRTILSALRSDYKAIENYRFQPGPPLNCPITVLVGDRDPVTTIDEARSWQEHTAAECDLNVLPGGHFYLINKQEEVIDIVSRSLRRTT